MNRYRSYSDLDDVPRVVGDAGFTRLDMLTDPAMLPPGSLAISENMRFDTNGTTVRGGMLRLFQPGTSTSRIFCAAVFKPDDGTDTLALVLESSLVLFDLATLSVTIANYPDGVTVSADDSVWLEQGGVGNGTLPQLYILRGNSKEVMKYDGNLGSISIVTTITTTGGVTTITGFYPGTFALFYQDRMAVANGQDVEVSDFLDFTTFKLLNQFQILKGGNDYLRCFVPYQGDLVLIGTTLGWYVAYFDPTITTGGYSGSLSDNSFVRVQTKEAGPVGPDAAIEAGGKVWFLSSSGIYAFQPNINNQLVVLGKPLSAPIQPIISRLCLTFANRASVKRYGYRLYFAMPISDLAIQVTAVSVENTGPDYPATLTLKTPHNLLASDTVLITGAAAAELNAQFAVVSIVDPLTITINLGAYATVGAGISMFCQRIATRNNCIAVFNLNNNEWESIDWMPSGFAADWMREVQYGAGRRLVVIDQNSGPMLYEQGDADDVGTVLGGIHLTIPPLRLPFRLHASNYAQKPIQAQLLTRSFRWGAGSDVWTGNLTNQIPRKVRQAEVRAQLDPAAKVTLNVLVRTPNHRLWTGTRSFAADDFETPDAPLRTDAPLRKMVGERGLETQLQILTAGGRPTFRSFAVEIAEAGKTE